MHAVLSCNSAKAHLSFDTVMYLFSKLLFDENWMMEEEWEKGEEMEPY